MDRKVRISSGSILARVGRRLSHYVSSIGKWNREYFTELNQKRAVARQRATANKAHYPLPEEIFSQHCCFVLSTGRCGTSLLTQILQKSPNLIVCHSPKPELEYVSRVIHQTNPTVEALELAALAARFESLVDAALRGKLYVETNNRISLFAPALASLFPNSTFIHLVRNPADFVRSGMRRNYYGPDNIQHQRLCPIDNQEWSVMTQLEKIAWEWNEINSAIETFKSAHDQSRVTTIKSEDLFARPEITLEIFEFLGVTAPFKKTDLQYLREKLLAKPVNRQTAGEFPKYPDWSQRDKDALRALATLAPRYGYELV